MAKKNRDSDSKDFAQKQTLNPPAGGSKPNDQASIPNPSNVGTESGGSGKVGQFTGRGAPGYQKK